MEWLINQEFHKNITHLGSERSQHLAKSRVYCSKMEKYITFFIDNECPCSASKWQHVTPHASLGTVTSTLPIEITVIDFSK